MKIIMGLTSTFVVTVIGWTGYSSTQRLSAISRINPKTDSKKLRWCGATWEGTCTCIVTDCNVKTFSSLGGGAVDNDFLCKSSICYNTAVVYDSNVNTSCKEKTN